MPWTPEATAAGGLDTGGDETGGEDTAAPLDTGLLDTGLDAGGEDVGLDGGRLNARGLLAPPGAALDPVGD